MAAKQSENTFVKCINCKWADLMQWFENPVIAHCNKRDERQVAETRRQCKEHVETTNKPSITHYDHYDL